MLENATRKQDLRRFEDWFGVGDEGHKTKDEAEAHRQNVDASLKDSTGEVEYESTVEERIGYSGYWVHVKRTVDYNHPDRIEKRL